MGYRECLAEWAVVNGQTWEDIDLQLRCGTLDQAKTQVPASAPDGGKRVMCPLGGGKDSLVVFEMLRYQDAFPMPIAAVEGSVQPCRVY